VPELPEVETVVRTLAPRLTGRRILMAAFTSRHVTPGDRRKLAAHLSGQTVCSIRRRGKFILITLDDGMLIVHLGMTGRLLIDGRATEHTYGIFELDHGTMLYTDPRQFGSIEWSRELPERIASLGPEPLEVACEEFCTQLRRRNARIKPLLLNQQFLAGVGNIYADESLFRAGIHPLAMASRLSRTRAERLHQAIRSILSRAIEQGGSSISDYVDANGEKGWFQIQHNVYGREGESCRECSTPIRKIVLGQRGTHYCPKCQKR
jgi:formamidopyrimidine-DNA glycosylase